MPLAWTQGEIFIAVKSLNATNNPAGLWLMGNGALTSWYPDTSGQIQENFGRGTFALITGVPTVTLSTPHLYNVVSRANAWTNRFNNLERYWTTANTVGFNNAPRLGWGGSGENFQGYISELMIFDSELSAAERGAVANYLRGRFDLW